MIAAKKPVTKKTPAKKTPAKKKLPKYAKKVVGSMALWVLTPFGPLSVAIRPPHTVTPGDTQTLQVRARRKEHLDTFRARWCPALGPVLAAKDVAHATDYNYRAYVTPADFAAALSAMALAIDSTTFKDTTEGPGGLADRKLAASVHSAYTKVWNNLASLGDGSSPYDSWSHAKKYVPAGAAECQRLGHYFPPGQAKCLDCLKTRPKGFRGMYLPWDPAVDKVPTLCDRMGHFYALSDGQLCYYCREPKAQPEPAPVQVADGDSATGKDGQQAPWYTGKDGEEFWPK